MRPAMERLVSPITMAVPADRHLAAPMPGVMQVVLSLDPGGTERLVIEIIRRLSTRVQFSVCCLDEAGRWSSEVADLGVPVVSLRREPGFHLSLGRRIAALARQSGVRVLHCHHYSPFVYSSLAALLYPRLRVVFTEHGRLSDSPPSRRRQLANLLLARVPSRVCAVSGSLREHLATERFSPGAVEVVYNGIDPGVTPGRTERVQARRELGLPDHAPVIGTVGRLDQVKNLALLLQAFALVREHVSDARLVIVGDGPERPLLRAAAERCGVGSDVVFTGHRQDVRHVLAAMNVYANSSNYEGVSLTILEAMATGLPVVATAVGGTPEVVVDGETGTLVPAGSAIALGRALLRLLLQPPLAAAMGRAGRFRLEHHFTLDAMTDRYRALYHALGVH